MVRMPAPPRPKPDQRPAEFDTAGIAVFAVLLCLAVSFFTLITVGAWLGGGFITETPALHNVRPSICARGYEI